MTNINNNILKLGSKNLNLENWKVYHPNGRHMFTCGENKANWYLEKNLAIAIGDKEIKFTFDPKGYGFEDNEEFGRSIRESICVVTGIPEGLQRHHIVPYCYRTYFPEVFKTKNHHDVVLINHTYHSKYEKSATKYKDEIANIYGVHTIDEYNNMYTSKLRELGKEYGITLNAISSIFKSYNNVNPEFILERLKIVSKYTEIPYETLCKYNYLQLLKLYQYINTQHEIQTNEFKKNYRMYFDHGYHVVKKLDTEVKLIQFIKLWRNHFINTMHPKFMPNGWSVDFRFKTVI